MRGKKGESVKVRRPENISRITRIARLRTHILCDIHDRQGFFSSFSFAPLRLCAFAFNSSRPLVFFSVHFLPLMFA